MLSAASDWLSAETRASPLKFPDEGTEAAGAGVGSADDTGVRLLPLPSGSITEISE